MISSTPNTREIIMTSRIIAAALLAASIASPALAQGLDSRRSPYPASAYPGYVAPAPTGAVRHTAASAYRYSGQHAGGPAGALTRY
jgi:hypothetical protein